MNKWTAKILNSKVVCSGPVGKLKDWIYYKFISDRQEAQTDKYRDVILKDINEIYKDVEWILGFGSFLRYIRDHTMEGQDIDILIRYEDYLKGKEQLQKKGYSLFGEFTDSEGRITEHKLRYENVEIDMFFVFEKDEKFYYAGTFVDEEHKDNVIRLVKENQRIVCGEGYVSYYKMIPDMETSIYTYEGIKFNGYKHYEEHLKAEYGDWKTPNPKYDPLEDHVENPFIKVPNAKVVYYFEEPLEKF